MELGLLILESVLLIFTITLLVMSIKEGRGRDELLFEVSKATKTLTRQGYFVTVMETMMDAEKEIYGIITGRKPDSDDLKRTKAIVADIEKLCKAGVVIRYLLPKFPDRLFIAHLYTKAGAEIRIGGCSQANDLRYIATEKNIVVIGVPERIGEKEATKKGYRIPSEDLSHLLRENFFQCWDSATSYEDYVKEVVHHTGASLKTLSQEFGISIEELSKYL